MIRCEKHLVSKTERSANQSEGCDARRKVRLGAVSCTLLCNPLQLCGNVPAPPKGQSVRGYGEVYGISFFGNHDRLALEKRQTKA